MAKMKEGKNPMDPKTVKRMYKNRVALPDDVKEKVCEIANVKLAAALDTYTQAKYAHWNVKGVNFYQLHLVFDATAKVIFKHIDAIAERITQLGGTANGTVRMSAANSPIATHTTANASVLRALAETIACNRVWLPRDECAPSRFSIY